MPLSNLLQTYMMLSQIKNQERQADQQDAIIHDRRLSEALAAMKDAPVENRDAVIQLYAPHLNQHDAQRLLDLRGMPESAATQRDIVTSQGYQGMTDAQRSALSQEAASTAFAGQNRGGVAGSGVQAAMFQNLSTQMQDPAFASSEIGKALAGGFAARQFTGTPDVGRQVASQYIADTPALSHEMGAVTATNQTALPRAQDAAMLADPAMVGMSAAIRNGLRLSAGEEANFALGKQSALNQRYGIDRQFEGTMADINGRMTAAGAKGAAGMTGEQYVALTGQLKSTLDTLSQKDLDARSQNMYVLQYNNIAKQIGMPTIDPGDDIPQKISWFRSLFQGQNQFAPQAQAAPFQNGLTSVMSQNGAQFSGMGSFNPNPIAR